MFMWKFTWKDKLPQNDHADWKSGKVFNPDNIPGTLNNVAALSWTTEVDGGLSKN